MSAATAPAFAAATRASTAIPHCLAIAHERRHRTARSCLSPPPRAASSSSKCRHDEHRRRDPIRWRTDAATKAEHVKLRRRGLTSTADSSPRTQPGHHHRLATDVLQSIALHLARSPSRSLTRDFADPLSRGPNLSVSIASRFHAELSASAAGNQLVCSRAISVCNRRRRLSRRRKCEER